jgi:putative protease
MIPNLRDLGVRRFRIELVRENAADVARLVRVYRELVSGQGDAERAWRELRADGGYGVVSSATRCSGHDQPRGSSARRSGLPSSRDVVAH